MKGSTAAALAFLALFPPFTLNIKINLANIVTSSPGLMFPSGTSVFLLLFLLTRKVSNKRYIYLITYALPRPLATAARIYGPSGSSSSAPERQGSEKAHGTTLCIFILCMCVHTHMYVYMDIYRCINVCVYIYSLTHVYIHTYIHTHTL